MGRRLMVVLAWVASTVLAATVAWAAVGTVGHGAGATEGAVLSQDEVAAALAARQTAVAAAAPTADPTPPAADPTSSPTSTPDATAPPTTPTTTPTPPPPAEEARTWAVDGGTLGATCRGSSISHDYATPTDGWGVEVKNRGPEATEVQFESERGETKVTAVCVAGVPVMTATSGGAEGGNDGGDD